MIKRLIFLLTFIFLLTSLGVSWDMTGGSSGNFTSDSTLVGKTVHIVQFDEGSKNHIVTTITGISNEMLQTSDWWQGWNSLIFVNNSYKHFPGTHYIAISTINGMWEEKLPAETSGDEQSPAPWGIMSLIALISVILILRRR